MRQKAFTLVEVLVSLAVFSLVMSAATIMLMSLYDSWQRQRRALDTIQNLRWATEFIARDLRQCERSKTTAGGGSPSEKIRITLPGNSVVWYWRGDALLDGTQYGNSSYLYRGAANNIASAYAGRQELANLIVENPIDPLTGSPIPAFSVDGRNVTICLTARPDPFSAGSAMNRDITFSTTVMMNNE